MPVRELPTRLLNILRDNCWQTLAKKKEMEKKKSFRNIMESLLAAPVSAVFGVSLLLLSCGYYSDDIFLEYIDSAELLCLNVFPIVCLTYLLYASLGRAWLGFFLSGGLSFGLTLTTMAIVLVLAITMLNYFPGARSFRTWWCAMTMQDSAQIKQLYRMGDIPKFCNIYVRGADKDLRCL